MPNTLSTTPTHFNRLSIELPHLTVAVVVEQEGKFLVVEEEDEGQIAYNQPAGHVENDETIAEAALRETLEETAWGGKLESIIGIYHYTAPNNGIRYVRVCFAASPIRLTKSALDPDIRGAHWLTLQDLSKLTLRSPLVCRVIEDYQAGIRFPLSLIRT